MKIKKKPAIVAGIVLLLAVILGAAFALGLFGSDKEKQPDEKAYSQLTGMEVQPDIAKRPVLGVMIENSQAARPQTGLGSAGIVFEAVTEGGITRYLALYQEGVPKEVGPVRSLRVHFLNWATGFDASIAHVGGSAQALELVNDRDAKSLNQFKYSEPYYRSDDRPAPHNVYAKTKALRELQRELDHKQSQFADIPRSDDSPSQEPQASKIMLDYSSPLYKVEFRYNQATNSYTRYLAGEPHLDRATKEPITVKNLIVLKTDEGENPQDSAIGSGEALVFKNGNVITARWQKSSYKERVKIIDNRQNEVALNRGASWFAALSEERPVTY